MTTIGTPSVQVVGASIAGMGVALALANRGIPSTLHDADDFPMDAFAEDLRREPRQATPQAAHSHAFISRSVALLRAEAPDVLDDLLAAGVEPIDLVASRPSTVPEGAATQPGDDELVVLPARRTTFEAALRAAVARRPEIAVRRGRRATGLVLDRAGAVPRVAGVAFDGDVATGDVVVDAGGRRSPVTGWLEQEGIDVVDDRIECGITYFTRFYRLLDGADGLPLNRGYTHGSSYDRYSCLVFPADDGTFSITFGTLPEDRALRALRHDDAFDAAARSLEDVAPWVDPSRAEPISPVRMMAGLKNRLRRTVVDGTPAVLGLAQVGDAAATTNPAHSRGCTLSLVHGVAVARAIAGGGSAADLALAFDRILDDEQRPWVEDSIDQDEHRLGRWRPDAGIAPSTAPDRLANGEAYVAAQHDAYAWRRFTRLQQLLERPDDVLADPRMVARVRAVQARGAGGVPRGAAPDHDDLAALLAAAS